MKFWLIPSLLITTAVLSTGCDQMSEPPPPRISSVPAPGTGTSTTPTVTPIQSGLSEEEKMKEAVDEILLKLEKQKDDLKVINGEIEKIVSDYPNASTQIRENLESALNSKYSDVQFATNKIKELFTDLEILQVGISSKTEAGPYYDGVIAGQTNRAFFDEQGKTEGDTGDLDKKIANLSFSYPNPDANFILGYQNVVNADYANGLLFGYRRFLVEQLSDNDNNNNNNNNGGECPSKKYGSLFQCGANICAKSDANFLNTCVARKNEQLTTQGNPNISECPTAFYGSVYQCGDALCAKSDAQYQNMCVLTGSGAPINNNDNNIADCNSISYGSIFQCGNNVCAKSDADFEVTCVLKKNTQTPSSTNSNYDACGTPFYGSAFTCGNSLCAKSDAAFKNICSL